MLKALRDPAWWDAAATRAIKTMAQAALGIVGTNAIGVTDVDLAAMVGAAALAALVSLLTSLAGLPEVEG